jgi:hypothetical protein
MKPRVFNWCSACILFALIAPVHVLAAADDQSYSGKWQSGDRSSELIVDQTGDDVHVKEERGGKILCEYTCKLGGKNCSFKEEGKKATVSVYFNGPKLVEIRTRGEVVLKRRFGLKNDGKTMEVELMPIAPPGKTETILYAKQ